MLDSVRAWLEAHQIPVYFGAIGAGFFAAFAIPGAMMLEWSINPALARILFVTFLQVPLSDLP